MTLWRRNTHRYSSDIVMYIYIYSTCSLWLQETIKLYRYHCLLVWRNAHVNWRYYVYIPFGARYACCNDVGPIYVVLMENVRTIAELSTIYLAYFTLHWTCVVIMHK